MLTERKGISWVLPESLEPAPLIDDIGQVFSTAREAVSPTTRTWFDTFDWRLYQRGLFLFHDKDNYHLFQRESVDITAFLPQKGLHSPVFSWDFPVSRIRSILEPVVEMRSLLPLVTYTSLTTCLRIMNRDHKTVARVFLEEHKIPQHDVVLRTVTLRNIRGYEKDFKVLSRFFVNYGIQDKTDLLYPFIKGVKLCGRKPLDYSSKFELKLKKEYSALQAMILIYKHLLKVMHQNEAGVLDDLDSEFLHDFRVAVRRTRSGLGQVRNVLPTDITNRAKKDFAWLGSVTGPTRDLDVYLLYEQNYRARLPGDLQAGLDTFFADIRARRVEEYQKLIHHLKSSKCRRILDSWRDYLYSSGGGKEVKNSGRPVIELARDIIFRKYKKVMQDGTAITPASPDQNLHRLRIQCKKLRYTLEFFSSLFPRKEMKRVIKQLRRLQNNLGDFNDLSVQQDMLHNYRLALRPGSKKNQGLAASLGGLSTNLYHQQYRVRENFAPRFREFSASPNVKLYTTLFGKRA